MWNRIKDGFKQYPVETAGAVWWVLVQAGVAGGVIVVLVGVLIFAVALWMAR